MKLSIQKTINVLLMFTTMACVSSQVKAPGSTLKVDDINLDSFLKSMNCRVKPIEGEMSYVIPLIAGMTSGQNKRFKSKEDKISPAKIQIGLAVVAKNKDANSFTFDEKLELDGGRKQKSLMSFFLGNVSIS